MDEVKDRRLGESTELIELSTSDEHREVALALANQATHSVDIVSRHLDPAVYDQAPLLEAIKQMALNHRRSRVRILVKDLQPILTGGHRLAALASRLSSFVEIRVPAVQHKDFNEAFMIVDESGFIHVELADRYEGIANFADRGLAGELRRKFDEMWSVATPDLP